LIRRLKDKLGTKGLPTGEIDLIGAEAIEVAAPPQGFQVMMEALEYSRIHNAVSGAGVLRRAFTEAVQWCKSRKAFGHAIIHYPMVQDELLRMLVQLQAGTLLAFEAAIALDAALADSTRRIWLRLVTALAKYLTAEYAIHSCRAALELIGGNGYTSDHPVARIYRDAQVLSVWEGPANIQALELLRLLDPKYAGCMQYEGHVRAILDRIPDQLATLRQMLNDRLSEDLAAIAVVTRDQESRARYARKLLHRLSESLAFALMCEVAIDAHSRADELPMLAAGRYYGELQAPRIGAEDERVIRMTMPLIEAAFDQEHSSVKIP
jgi:hypothetical protein